MRQLRRVDQNPHFLRAATIEGDLGHPVDTSKRLDNLRFQKIAEPLEIDRLSRFGNQRKTGDRAVIGIRGSDLWRSRIRRQACDRRQLAEKQH